MANEIPEFQFAISNWAKKISLIFSFSLFIWQEAKLISDSSKRYLSFGIACIVFNVIHRYGKQLQNPCLCWRDVDIVFFYYMYCYDFIFDELSRSFQLVINIIRYESKYVKRYVKFNICSITFAIHDIITFK
jgi:hypothetical protein